MKKLILSILMLGVMMFAIASVSAASTIFSDGFESDNFNNWDQSDNDWYTSSIDEHSGSYAAVTFDSENDALRKEVSTVGYNNIVLSYWYKIAEDLESSDHVYVEWYDGSTWHELADYTDMDDGSWTFESFSLPSGAVNNPDFEIRFRSVSLEQHYQDKFRLDDVSITGNAIEGGCSDCEIEIDEPEEGHFYSTVQGDLLIDWTATGEDCGSAWDLFYGFWNSEDGCDLDSEDWEDHIAQVYIDTEYQWDVSIFDEGKLCVKVEGDCCDDAVEGPFYVDNLEPIADANGETCWCDEEFYSPCGDCCGGCCEPEYEEGVYTCYEGDSIILDGTGSDDVGDFPSGIATWKWYLDGTYYGEGETLSYECVDGDRTVNVELVVTDNVGNSDSDTAIINELNVAPVCEGIDAPTDIAVGFEVTFTGSGSDVDADLPLTYDWDLDDGTLASGNPLTHIYTSAGEYEVMLTVSDDDGGSDVCYHTIDVVDPVVLDNQEVAAYYPLIADFGDDAGDAGPIPFGPLAGTNPSFETGLVGMEMGDCDVIVGPTNLFSYSIADGECRVRWDNDEPPYGPYKENPTNDEQGNHYVLIRAQGEEGTYQYFTFNVMVYSWIIDLEEGWNLISIPYVPEDSSICGDDVGFAGILSSVDAVWSYEYEACEGCEGESVWKYYTGDCGDSLTNVVPGRGYWVDMNGPAQLKGFGTQTGQTGEFPGMPPEIEVPTNNWALIGRYGILGDDWYHYPGETCWDAGAIGKITALESLTKLDNELHVFDVDVDGHLNDVYKLWNNQGYWLWVEDEALNNAESETYAPLDRFYREDLQCGGCPHGPIGCQLK